MKSNTRKKVLALFAASALATAGVAWAAVSNGSITSSTTGNATNLDGAHNAASQQYNLGEANVVLAGNVILPTSTDVAINTANSASQILSVPSLDITVGASQTFTIRPEGTSEAVGNAAGYLRLKGTGVTSIYSARNNLPNASVYNTYAGGTLLKEGRLEIGHSNAVGVGDLLARTGATLAFIDTDIELGNLNPAGASIKADQEIFLLRSDDREIDAPEPSYFDVTTATISTTPLTFIANSIIRENVSNHPQSNWRATAPNAGVQLVKRGAGTMFVRQDGSWHTGGTVVEQGILSTKQVAGLSDQFVGEMGRTWTTEPPVEDNSAKTNYGANARYLNNLVVSGDATFETNRNQFFANFDGSGNFRTDYWTKAQANQIIQIAVQLSDYYAAPDSSHGYDSTYSGPMTGPMRLVLDNPVTFNAALNNEVTDHGFTYGRPRMLSLTGANNITDGDTTIKDGILSVNKAEGTLPPGTIRVGLNNRAMINDGNGVNTGNTTFRGFAQTVVNATFHAKESFAVAQPTEALVRNSNIFANLAAVSGSTVSFSDIVLQSDARSDLALANVPTNRGIPLSNAVRINDQYGGYYTNWNGTIAFTDKYEFPGTDGGNRLGIRVRNGKLHLEKTPVSGVALMAVEEGAILSLGNEARDFTETMDLYLQDDSRIDVVVQTGDLYDTESAALNGAPIFKANVVDYDGLGTGDANKDRRFVIGVDIANVSTSLFGKWIPLMSSVTARHWNYTHYLRESSGGQTEDKQKVVVAYLSSTGEPIDINADDYEIRLDERTHTILVNIKKLDTTPPVTSENWTITNSVATNSQISGTAKLQAKSGDVYVPVTSEDATIYLFHSGVNTSDNSNAIESAKTVTDASGNVSYNFNKGGYGVNADYVIKAVAAGYDDRTVSVKTAAGSSSSGSSGCDAGFGAFALLAAAGGAVVLRKKD